MKTDTQLRHDVEAELEWDPSFDARKIGVAGKSGVVTLTGHVNSYMERLAAQKATQTVAGVKAIANEIQVSLLGDSQRSDTDIAEAALNALSLNMSVPAASIKVVATDGWLTLNGQVVWWFERNEAEIAVRSLRGVKGVSNEITIKPTTSVGDIKTKIETAFQRHALRDAKAIRVTVDGGTVMLDGEVHTWQERQDAEVAAWAAPGVMKVTDRLAIRL